MTDPVLVSALRDCVAALEAIIGRREPGFAIEEILDAAIAALKQADGEAEHGTHDATAKTGK